MRITIINPTSLLHSFGTQWKVHRYFAKFIQKYNPNIFLTDAKRYLILGSFCYKTNTKLSDFSLITTLKGIQRNTDVLIYPWGIGNGDKKKLERIGELFRSFDGMKIFHVMDPQILAFECNQMLEDWGVDFILGYSRHDYHSEFFRKMYPRYIGKVIDVPFGFNEDWTERSLFHERDNKCLGTGTIDLFDSPAMIKSRDKLQDFFDFFGNNYHSIHELRYLVNRNAAKYSGLIDCSFHDKSASHKNYVHDIVGLFNKYKLFLNDESLLSFPPIRTYEGTAAGCVMVCHEDACYKDYGFKDEINCITFNKYALDEMIDKIRYYLFDAPEKLEAIQKKSVEFVRSFFNHTAIANLMYEKIHGLFSRRANMEAS
jgi:hypothetical protein